MKIILAFGLVLLAASVAFADTAIGTTLSTSGKTTFCQSDNNVGMCFMNTGTSLLVSTSTPVSTSISIMVSGFGGVVANRQPSTGFAVPKFWVTGFMGTAMFK